ncbi:CHASE3 domain-containing protein [Ruania suaedae]|uniref:CHASE3 domain-containing protein n=1 Tax=Ruania suaedae TaxID=2897774 RepID=UPI001E47E611|nr:CHASE3 domain-containing protein [Ruania suaedae]UFU03467.1 CHASE3 domain-containing protein [Ruania suaedae]
MSDTDRLAEIEARVNAATDGPWEADARHGAVTSGPHSVIHGYFEGDCPACGEKIADLASVALSADDGDFIAHARSDVPYLLDQVRTLTAENEHNQEHLTMVRASRDQWIVYARSAEDERRRLAEKVRRVEELHTPRRVDVITGDCASETCDHENKCPTTSVQQCVQCDRIAEAANAYYSESGMSFTMWPCATTAALADPTPGPDGGGES